MKRRLLVALTLTAMAVLSGCASLGHEPPAPMAEALKPSGVPLSSIAVVAFPIDAPGTGLRLNADQLMQPASTMKTITAVVALDKLGPNSRGHTELLAAGEIRDGRLDGPLVLKGNGDADLDWPALWLMLRELRERHGLRELAGGVIVDRALFLPSRPELGVADFDSQPEFPYNVIPDALQLNGNLLQFDLASDARTVAARPFPQFGGLTIDGSSVTLVTLPTMPPEVTIVSPRRTLAIMS